YGRTLFRELAPRSNFTICRADIGSQSLRTAGDAHNRLERDCVELNSEREQARGTINKLARRHNLAIDSAKVRRPSRVAQHLCNLEILKKRIRETEAASTATQSEVLE